MSQLTILRTYALTNPSKLPPTVLFSSSASSITIFDGFPKSIFHFLVLPRVVAPFKNPSELSNLPRLLLGNKTRALELLTSLRTEAESLRDEIEKEMIERYGFKWGIWTGFHGAPSMDHLHLHVLSDDLCSDRMKHKKHYNSFHPKLGFFLSLDEVLSWFDAETSYLNSMSQLDPKRHYEPMLKEDLVCWRCDSVMKNMPTLKAHLQKEFEDLRAREQARMERKRKRAIEDSEAKRET